jgi:hypothetical protein
MIIHQQTFIKTNHFFSQHNNNLYLSCSFTLLLQHVSICVGHHQVSFISQSKVCTIWITKLFSVVLLAGFVWCTAIVVVMLFGSFPYFLCLVRVGLTQVSSDKVCFGGQYGQ